MHFAAIIRSCLPVTIPQRVYTDIRHWNELPRGGHFAAWEEPDLYVDEIRAFFRIVR